LDQVRQFIAIMQEYSILLILGVFAGLAVANLDHHLYEELVDYHVFGEQAKLFGHTITAHFLINEIFMVFFFGTAPILAGSRYIIVAFGGISAGGLCKRT